MHSYIRIIALRLGTLAVQRGGVLHTVLKPNHKTVFGGHLQKMEGLLKQPKTRPKVGRAQGLTKINTNLVLPSGKPRCTSYYFKL